MEELHGTVSWDMDNLILTHAATERKSQAKLFKLSELKYVFFSIMNKRKDIRYCYL